MHRIFSERRLAAVVHSHRDRLVTRARSAGTGRGSSGRRNFLTRRARGRRRRARKKTRTSRSSRAMQTRDFAERRRRPSPAPSFMRRTSKTRRTASGDVHTASRTTRRDGGRRREERGHGGSETARRRGSDRRAAARRGPRRSDAPRIAGGGAGGAGFARCPAPIITLMADSGAERCPSPSRTRERTSVPRRRQQERPLGAAAGARLERRNRENRGGCGGVTSKTSQTSSQTRCLHHGTPAPRERRAATPNEAGVRRADRRAGCRAANGEVERDEEQQLMRGGDLDAVHAHERVGVERGVAATSADRDAGGADGGVVALANA